MLMFLQQKSVEEAIGPGAAIVFFVAIVAVAGYLVYRFVIKKK